MVDDVFTNGRVLVEPDAAPTDVPTMPLEFSVAAFRLGRGVVGELLQLEPPFPGYGGLGLPTCSTSRGSAAAWAAS